MPQRLGRVLGIVMAALMLDVAAPVTMPGGTSHGEAGPEITATVAAASKTRRRRRAPQGGVYARHAIVLDPATDEVLFEKNADSAVPIASLTKLMTAIVYLENEPDLSQSAEVTWDELNGGGRTQLRSREKVRLGDLLRMSLMVSDNVATRVLVRESGLSKHDFLSRMNRKALELGLTHTRFVEFTGLDERNVSTAADVARLLRAAAKQPLIRSISTTRSYEFRTRRRSHFIGNTNRLLYGDYEILGGKTGFIQKAGYCFATWLRTDDREMIAVVLGAPTAATRFADVVRMVKKTTAAATASTTPAG